MFIYKSWKVNFCIVAFDLKNAIFSFPVTAQLVPNDPPEKPQEHFLPIRALHIFPWMTIRIMSPFDLELDRLNDKYKCRPLFSTDW